MKKETVEIIAIYRGKKRSVRISKARFTVLHDKADALLTSIQNFRIKDGKYFSQCTVAEILNEIQLGFHKKGRCLTIRYKLLASRPC